MSHNGLMATSRKLKKSAQVNGDGLPRGEAAYRYIRSAIQGGQFKPGERLREIELAKQVGLSRTPIREALSRLETEGLVAHDPTRGVVVADLDDLCQQYEAALSDHAALTMSNRRFHETLYRCSHNRYLLNMVTVLHDALSLLGGTTLDNPERAAETLREHRAVVTAIRARDADAAEQALRAHIRAAQKVRMQKLFASAP